MTTKASEGTASFFIRDLLTATPTEVGFVQFEVNFIKIFLCGFVSDKTWSSAGDKLIYKVEDGTGCIYCILKTSRTSLGVQNRSDLEKLKHQPEDNLTQMALITARKTNQLLTETECEYLNPGDYVRIVGKMKLYKNVRRVFIDKIEKCVDIQMRIDYLERLHFLYGNMYAKNREERPQVATPKMPQDKLEAQSDDYDEYNEIFFNEPVEPTMEEFFEEVVDVGNLLNAISASEKVCEVAETH